MPVSPLSVRSLCRGSEGFLSKQVPTVRDHGYQDRREAGRVLADSLCEYADDAGALVLALPRGGVPVAFEVARALRLPLDLLPVRKLGVPGHEELAFGALAPGAVRVLNSDLTGALGLDQAAIEAVVAREMIELDRREALYRKGRAPLVVTGRIVLLVDDGLATGATMRAAVQSLLRQIPRSIIVAVPVAPPASCLFFDRLTPNVRCVCPLQPDDFDAVGEWYQDFSQTSDEEVLALLAQAGWGPQPSY